MRCVVVGGSEARCAKLAHFEGRHSLMPSAKLARGSLWQALARTRHTSCLSTLLGTLEAHRDTPRLSSHQGRAKQSCIKGALSRRSTRHGGESGTESLGARRTWPSLARRLGVLTCLFFLRDPHRHRSLSSTTLATATCDSTRQSTLVFRGLTLGRNLVDL